jgi:hypothetical protein
VAQLLVIDAAGQAVPDSSWNLEIPVAATDVVMHQRTIREPMAKVTDRNNRPIAGIAVTFLILPEGGAGATFPGGQLSLQVKTNAEGIARGAGMQHNGIAGNYRVQVTAEYNNQTQTKEMRYRNVRKHSSKYWLSVAAILAVVGTATTVAATRSGSGNPEITLGPGTVTR